MSRTDIHRPMFAMAQDPTMREHFQQFHDHSTGSCDYDTFLAALLAGRWVRTRCRLQWWSELRICGCPRCVGQSQRQRARRQERHMMRRALHEAAGQYTAGDLDEDLPRSHRAAAW